MFLTARCRLVTFEVIGCHFRAAFVEATPAVDDYHAVRSVLLAENRRFDSP